MGSVCQVTSWFPCVRQISPTQNKFLTSLVAPMGVEVVPTLSPCVWGPQGCQQNATSWPAGSLSSPGALFHLEDSWQRVPLLIPLQLSLLTKTSTALGLSTCLLPGEASMPRRATLESVP